MQEQTETRTEAEEVLAAVKSAFVLSIEQRLTLFERVLELANREYRHPSE